MRGRFVHEEDMDAFNPAGGRSVGTEIALPPHRADRSRSRDSHQGCPGHNELPGPSTMDQLVHDPQGNELYL